MYILQYQTPFVYLVSVIKGLVE